MPYSAVKVYRRFGAMYYLHHRGGRINQTTSKKEATDLGLLFERENGGISFLRKAGKVYRTTW
jgi:hypothetical protein